MAHTRTKSLLVRLLPVLVLAGCAGGGGDSASRGGASEAAAAGPSEIVLAAVVQDAQGRPLVGWPCRVEPLGPSVFHTEAAGLQAFNGRTDAAGRMVFRLPREQVLGPNGGRFYRAYVGQEVPGALMPVVRFQIDAFLGGAGADLGTLTLWNGKPRAVEAVNAVRVGWDPADVELLTLASGYKVELKDGSETTRAAVNLTGIAMSFDFDVQTYGAALAESVIGRVTAHTRTASTAGPAYVSFTSPAVPLPAFAVAP